MPVVPSATQFWRWTSWNRHIQASLPADANRFTDEYLCEFCEFWFPVDVAQLSVKGTLVFCRRCIVRLQKQFQIWHHQFQKLQFNLFLFTCGQKLTEIRVNWKRIMEKLKLNHWVVRSPWRQSGWSPVGSPVGRRMIYGGKDLWNRWVLSLEWKREEVMDGVMVVTHIHDDLGSTFPKSLFFLFFKVCSVLENSFNKWKKTAGTNIALTDSEWMNGLFRIDCVLNTTLVTIMTAICTVKHCNLVNFVSTLFSFSSREVRLVKKASRDAA